MRNHPDFETIVRRIETEEVIWLVTVRTDGQPQASPVWAILDGDTFLIYSQPEVGKLANIAANPRVVLHLDGGVHDHTTAIFEGEAAVSDDPPADQVPAFVEKYAEGIERLGWTPGEFATDYSVPIRVFPHKLRAW